MGKKYFTKYINQKKEYEIRQQNHKEYQRQLKDYETIIEIDFKYIKENITEFDKGNASSMTCLEKQELKKIKNRYYRNKDYCRFLRRKIERTV
jgi:hypothetical protein